MTKLSDGIRSKKGGGSFGKYAHCHLTVVVGDDGADEAILWVRAPPTAGSRRKWA